MNTSAVATLPGSLLISLIFIGCTTAPREEFDPTEEYYPGAKRGTLYIGLNDDGSIYAYDTAAKSLTRLVDGTDPVIASDGMLVCRHSAGLVEYAAGSGDYRLIVARNLVDGEERTYNDECHAPQVSRDGRFVAYEGDRRDVYVVDRTSGELLATLDEEGWTLGYGHPSWTLDNRLVVAGDEERPGLFMTDAAWRTVTPIGPELFGARTPSVSPDGSTIIFSWSEAIYTIGIDGMNLEMLSRIPGINPVWSPDGLLFAFALSNGEGFSAYNVCFFDPSTQIMTEPLDEVETWGWWSDMSPQVAMH